MTQKRLTLSFPERTIERLEALKELTEAPTTTDVVRDAIKTYEALAMYLSEGVQFVAVKPSGERVEVDFMIDVPKPQRPLTLVKA